MIPGVLQHSLLKHFPVGSEPVAIQSIRELVSLLGLKESEVCITDIEEFLLEHDREIQEEELADISDKIISHIETELNAGREFNSDDLDSLLSSQEFLLADMCDVMMEMANRNLVLEGDRFQFMDSDSSSPTVGSVLPGSHQVPEPLSSTDAQEDREDREDKENREERVAEQFFNEVKDKQLVDISFLGNVLEDPLYSSVNAKKLIRLLSGLECRFPKNDDITSIHPGGSVEGPGAVDSGLTNSGSLPHIVASPSTSAGRPKLVLNEPLKTRSWRREHKAPKLHPVSSEKHDSDQSKLIKNGKNGQKGSSRSATDQPIVDPIEDKLMPDFTENDDVVSKYEKWDKFIQKKKETSRGKGSSIPASRFYSLVLAGFLFGGGIFYQVGKAIEKNISDETVCRANRDLICEAIKLHQVLSRQKLRNAEGKKLTAEFFEGLGRNELNLNDCPSGGEYTLIQRVKSKSFYQRFKSHGDVFSPDLKCSVHKKHDLAESLGLNTK